MKQASKHQVRLLCDLRAQIDHKLNEIIRRLDHMETELNDGHGSHVGRSSEDANAAAVALVALRNKKLSPKRRSEIAAIAGSARLTKLTPEQRSEIALNAVRARWARRAAE
jgi:hypothetical protein